MTFKFFFSFLYLIYLSTCLAMAQLPEQLQEHSLQCGEKASCPAGVVKVIGIEPDKKNSYQCTGFLVANNVVATNRHCLPDDLIKINANCKSRLFVQFQTISKKTPEFSECSKILSFAKPANGKTLENSDYAFFELTGSTNKTPLTTAADGARIGSTLTLWKVDGLVKSLIKKDHCQVTSHTLLSPFSENSKSPVLALKGCTEKHGHSGSPLLNEQGKAVAIFEGISNEKSYEYFKEKFSLKSIQKILKAPNFSCICTSDFLLPSTGSCQLPIECNETHTENDFLAYGNRIFLNNLIQNMNSLSKKVGENKSLSSAFLWQKNFYFDSQYSETRLRPDSFHVGNKPKCIKNQDSLLKESKALSEPTPEFNRFMVVDNAVDCSVKFKLSPYLEVTNAFLSVCSPARILISFDSESLAKAKKTRVRYSLINKNDELTAWKEDELSACQ